MQRSALKRDILRGEGNVMHAMLRTYSGPGAKAFAKLMEERKADIEKIVKSVPNLVSYSVASTGDGAFSVTVGKDKASVDDMHKQAMAWIKEHAGHTKVKAPSVSEGSVILHL
jgi:hypothetical protein